MESRNDGTLLDVLNKFSTKRATGSSIFSQQELDLCYRDSKIIQNVVNLKPEDATKYLPQWNLTKGDVDRLRGDYLGIRVIGQPLEELNVQSGFAKAGRYGEHYGDGFIFLGVNDGLNPKEPVDEAKIKSVDWMAIMHRYEIGVDQVQRGYRVHLNPISEIPGNQMLFHQSRVLRIPGTVLHGNMLTSNGGFNDSVIQTVYNAFLDYSQAIASSVGMVESHSLFKYKLKGLASKTQKNKPETLRKRFEAIIQGISAIGGLIFDADTEDADFIQRTYGGFDKILDKIELWLLAATGMPRGKVFGNAAISALSEAGESEKWAWNEIIERYQRNKLLPAHNKLTRYLLAAQGITERNGVYTISYRPHYQLTEKQLAEVKHINAETDKIYKEIEVLDPEIIRKSRFAGSEYGQDIILEA
ncbi:MAG: phage portal protein [Xenococcus sp. (in: cyanobacteria)]